MTAFPGELLAAWGFEGYFSAVRPESGTMNETWLVDLGAGRKVVLRRHRRTDRVSVEYEHAVLAVARAADIPCAEVLRTVEGAGQVESDGRFHSLYSWAPGVQLRLAQISLAQAAGAGETLARIHLALRRHPRGPWRDDPPYDPAAVDARLCALAAVVEKEDWLAEELAARRRWLAHRPDFPPAPPERRQVIHGDYQLTNLFFEGGAVSCVIDWDKSRPGWPAWEVVRTLDYAMGMDPARGSAFIDGYRSVLSLPFDELRAAAVQWGHHTAHDVWLYEEVYVEGNARAASLIDTRPWVPFIERWEQSGLA